MDDYGGPYREVFQLICDELQSPDPSSFLSSSPAGNAATSDHHPLSSDSNSKDVLPRGEIAMTPLRHDVTSTPKALEHPSTPSSHPRDVGNAATIPTTPASSHSNHRVTSLSSSSPHPHTIVAPPVVAESEGGVGSGSGIGSGRAGGEELNKRAVRCFLPLLHPTPNWSLTSATNCAERYRFHTHTLTHLRHRNTTTLHIHTQHNNALCTQQRYNVQSSSPSPSPLP